MESAKVKPGHFVKSIDKDGELKGIAKFGENMTKTVTVKFYRDTVYVHLSYINSNSEFRNASIKMYEFLELISYVDAISEVKLLRRRRAVERKEKPKRKRGRKAVDKTCSALPFGTEVYTQPHDKSHSQPDIWNQARAST